MLLEKIDTLNMPGKVRFLALGDLVGRIARQTLKEVLPQLRKEYEVDFVIANGENLSHGIGQTTKTCEEVLGAGVDFLTGGNHISSKESELEVYASSYPVIRPANFPEGVPGDGYRVVEVQGISVAIINLVGRVFMRSNYDCPFRAFDRIYDQVKDKAEVILVDFHAEATSEKIAFSWYVDGRATVVWGTHTHVATADARILPEGTLYHTDLGMVGALDSVLGVGKQGIIKTFLTQIPYVHEIPEKGETILNGLFFEIDIDVKKVTRFERVERLLKTLA